MKRKTIPIFIPHLGCPQQCVFCDQHSITDARAPSIAQVKQEILQKLSTIDRDHTEVTLAFFGGSFTAIARDQMIAYLEAVQPFGFDRIRISTRPDAIDCEVLSLLRDYRVTDIELGIQSTDDSVLQACRRGHTASQSEAACRLICRYGFVLGGQMMIGLPFSDAASEIQTARDICAWGAKQARIYPLCVFEKTPLADTMLQGNFLPISQEAAIERSANALEIFSQCGVSLLRIGLCETETLSQKIIGGTYHPAFGELVLGEVFYRRLYALLSQTNLPHGTSVRIAVPKGAISRAVGQNKRNHTRLCKAFSLRSLSFTESESLLGFACDVIL